MLLIKWEGLYSPHLAHLTHLAGSGDPGFSIPDETFQIKHEEVCSRVLSVMRVAFNACFKRVFLHKQATESHTRPAHNSHLHAHLAVCSFAFLLLTREQVGMIGMASNGEPHSASTQFYITLNPLSWLDGKRVVFGKVCGLAVVYHITPLSASRTNEPCTRLLHLQGSLNPSKIYHSAYSFTHICAASPVTGHRQGRAGATEKDGDVGVQQRATFARGIDKQSGRRV